VFFFEKKNQKTFATVPRSCRHLRAQLAKVFCFFSSEEKTFLYGIAPGRWRPGVPYNRPASTFV
jgi:hypothetical protein